MLVNPVKAVAVAEFKSLKHDEGGVKVLKLVEILLDEARRDNDTATGENVSRNQGKIAILTQLKSFLERETPPIGM